MNKTMKPSYNATFGGKKIRTLKPNMEWTVISKSGLRYTTYATDGKGGRMILGIDEPRCR